MKKTILSILCAATVCAVGPAAAQHYPERAVTVVTGYSPGGIGSSITRIYTEYLSKHLGETLVVQDKPGASGAIGAKFAASAAPDGYTLFSGGLNMHPIVFKNGVDLSKEMEPVTMIAAVPLVFLTSTKYALSTVDDIVKFAQKNPGALNFASSGGGANINMMMTLLADRVGKITYTHVPFKSAGEIQTALGRGDIHITALSALSALPAIQAGHARPVVIGGTARSSLLPDVPTLTEAGIKPFATDSISALWAPKGTPKEIIQKLSEAALATAKDPEYIKAVQTRTGVTPVGMTPEQTRAFYDDAASDLQEAARLANYQP